MHDNFLKPQFKVILSGAVLEFLEFKKRSELYISSDDSRTQAINRARRRLRRLINSNAGQWYDDISKKYFLPLFLTLTFRENITDIKYANSFFSDFVARFNYHFFQTKKRVLKYVVVVEFQQRGAVHYHAILFNVPFVENLHARISDVWRHGFVFVNSLKDVRNVGAYVVKYMSKEMQDDRLVGQKMYFASKNLLKPIVETVDRQVFQYLDLLPKDSLITSYDDPAFSYERHFLYNSFLRRMNTSRGFLLDAPGQLLSDVPVDKSLDEFFQGSIF